MASQCQLNYSSFFVNKHVDKYELVDIIYLDFQNTLDKVPHLWLLSKLNSNNMKKIDPIVDKQLSEE